MTSAAPRPLAVAAGNVVSLTLDPTCCRFEPCPVCAQQKGAFRPPFCTGGSCRMTSAAPCPLGRCRWQRCLTYARPDLLQVRTLPGLRTAKRRL
ncbi:hypothetical protein EAM_1183 [Erwinia amylovora ATCC 49946]|nr:hypothetical protein EAM_1183 [Erwinia amylovora ATCC 49946]